MEHKEPYETPEVPESVYENYGYESRTEEPETQQEETKLTAAQAAEQSGGLYCDELLTLLSTLNLLNEHEHHIAHQVIDLITAVQELHRDIANPPAEKKRHSGDSNDTLSAFREWAKSLAKQKGVL